MRLMMDRGRCDGRSPRRKCRSSRYAFRPRTIERSRSPIFSLRRLMPLICSICKHTERAAIETAHVEGASLRDIVKVHPGVTIWSLSRHFKHLPALIERATEEGARNRVSGKLPARVEQLIAEAEAIAKTAQRKRNYSAALAAIRTRLQCFEMLGKLSGELRPGNAVGEFIPGTVAAGAQANVTLNLNTDEPSAILQVRKTPEEFHELLRQIYGLESPRQSPTDAKIRIM
jgi:hypothetical protein